MFPDAVRLRRLLDYLSIKPLVDLAAMDEIQVVDPGSGNKLTQESLNKIDHIRKAVYSGNNYNQIGLFQFLIGLLFLEYGWFSEASESFGRAVSQWSYLPERPNICLANFAKGVAYHRGRRFDLAKEIYSEVEQQIIRIRNEVSGPSSIPQIKKYQAFENDLSAQLKEAQKTVTRDIFYDLSPRIHPSLQTDAQLSMATHLLHIDPDILRANIERNLNLVELRSLCLRMNIDYHGLYGQGLANKARELVAYCTRHQRLPEFFKELSRRNPSVLWEENSLQSDGGEFVDGEVLTAEPDKEDIIEALFEEAETVEEGTPFYRTPMGKVLFDWEEEGPSTRPYHMVVVNVDLSGDFKDFSLEQQEQFIRFLSRITGITPNQVTILEVVDGSIKVTVEMPDESAKQLIQMLMEDDPILKNFRILNIALGESVGRAGSAPPIVNVSPRQLERVTPQILRQFIFLYFNDNQLRDLYFELDVDYDSLPGRGKRDKAREIVAFCNRQKRFDRLVELCQKKRPKAFSEAFLMNETNN